MRNLSRHVPHALAPLAAIVALAALHAACSDDASSSYGGTIYPGTTTVQADGGAITTQPILVDVDPDKTLTAAPGQGVGVFVEYQTGGHWHVWWTCDTTKTSLNCVFDVKGSVDSGALANVQAEAFEPADTLSSPSAQSFEAKTTTTTAVDGVRFDAPLGATLTVDAAIGGLRDGSFYFFVQNGQVNGGYTGRLTDPLKFEASTP
jgi:hypothetical protein